MKWLMKYKIINKKNRKIIRYQTNEKVEEPKYSCSELQGKGSRFLCNYKRTSARARLETKKRVKEYKVNSEMAQKRAPALTLQMYFHHATNF